MRERQSEKGVRFRALHEGEPFLIPNPWDAGSAKVLEALGFEALASSSSALAFTFENGYGPEPEDAVRAIQRAAAAEAAHRLDFPFTFTARAENHIRGNPDLEDTISRLRAYEDAGDLDRGRSDGFDRRGDARPGGFLVPRRHGPGEGVARGIALAGSNATL